MSALAGSSRAATEQRVKSLRLDWYLLLSAVILLVVGLSALYSEGIGKPGGGSFIKQLVNVVIGAGPFALFLLIHPKLLQRQATLIYVLNLLLLVAVLVIGKKIMGAQRWIVLGPMQFEPSEIAKLLTVLTLSSFFALRHESIDKLGTFALSFVHVAAPMALIFKQPHLGSTLVITAIWLSVSIAAGVPMRFVLGFVVGFIALFALVWETPGVLKDYQRERILGLLHGNDKDNGYQALRSQIAFGEGGVAGEGFRKGEQKQARYIPEQNNDFIFTVIGEEGGLIGCSLVLIAYGFFFYRVWLVMFDGGDPYYRMVSAGVFGLLGFHTVVNLAMILQLLPVVGLWLPFLSAGGTAIWLCMSCVALLLNIRRRERPVLFS